MLANGDAHLKNWSLLYQDQVTPRLFPASDIMTTSVYMDDEREFALNLAKNKNWLDADFSSFERWAEKSDAPWRAEHLRGQSIAEGVRVEIRQQS